MPPSTSFLHPLSFLPFSLFLCLVLRPFLSRFVYLPRLRLLSLPEPPSPRPVSPSSLFSPVCFFPLSFSPASPPPEGQLNVNVLCLVTRLTRMVCDNESASGEEKEGGSETYQVPSTYKFLTFLLEKLHHLCEFTL